MALSRIPMIPEGTAGQPDTWPAAVPSTFNGPLSVVQDNLDALESVADDVTAAASGSDSLADKISSMATALESLSASDASAVLAAALFGQRQAGLHMALELFLGGVTLLDDLSNVSVLEAVAGDDSLDILDPDNVIRVGRDYILSDGVNSEQVTVTTLLADGRIRVTAPLAHAYANSTLSRTDWDVTTARATASNAQRYFAGPFAFGQRAKTVLARRTDNDCVLRCFYRRDSDDQWSEAASDLELSGNALDGLIDQAWTIPSDGGNDEAFTVQIVSQHGAGAVDAVVEHLAVVEDDTTSRIPVLTIQGADALQEQISAAVTLSNAGDYEWDTRLEIRALDGAGNDVTGQFSISFATGATTGSITPPAVDAGGQVFTIQARAAEEGLVRSAWSKGVMIQVGDTPVNKPVILSPAYGASGVGETPTIETDAFSSDTGKAHEKTQIQISTDANRQNIVFSVVLEEVNSYTLPAGVIEVDLAYYIWVRKADDDLVYSPWSDPVLIYTSSTFAVVHAPAFLDPLDGATDLPDGFTVLLDAYSCSGAGIHGGTYLQVHRVSDNSLLYDSGWLGPVLSIDVPQGHVPEGTLIRISAWMRDDSGTPVQSGESRIQATTAASFSDAAAYAAFDWMSEASLASAKTFVALCENPVAGGNEAGQGGPSTLTSDDRILTQSGNIAGAVGTPPARWATGAAYMSMSSGLISKTIGASSTWTLLFKASDAEAYNWWGLYIAGGNNAIHISTSHDNFHWLHVDVSSESQRTANTHPLGAMFYTAVWCDGTDVRAGFCQSLPTKWSDFETGDRLISAGAPSLFSGWSPTEANIFGQQCKAHGIILSTECLIDNNA